VEPFYSKTLSPYTWGKSPPKSLQKAVSVIHPFLDEFRGSADCRISPQYTHTDSVIRKEQSHRVA
jgi:hypothetical protein